MRSHLQIIADAGGAAALAAKIQMNLNTVRSWSQRGRIPVEAFGAIAAAGAATIEELIATRRPRGEPRSAAQDAA